MKRIICLLISALIVSCTPVNNTVVVDPAKVNSNSKKNVVVSTQPQVVVSSVKPDVKIDVSSSSKPIDIKDPNYGLTGLDKSGQSVLSPSPLPSPTPTTQYTPGSNNEFYPSSSPSPSSKQESDNRNISNALEVIYVPTPKPTQYPYAINEPVPDLMDGHYKLFFKDEYRIRYDKEKKIFYSLTGDDLKSVNDILISDNILVAPRNSGGDPILTEEQMSKDEIDSQATGFYVDYPNTGSEYTLFAKNTSSIDLVKKARQNSFVREFNYLPPLPEAVSQ